MKIVIVGPGAIGLLFTAFLSRLKEEIWLLDKDKDRAAQLDAKGIRVEGVSGSWHVKTKSTAEPRDIGIVDLVVVAVKSYVTKDVANKIKPLVGDDTLILTMQNGLGNMEILADIYGSEKVIGGLTSHGATLIGVGHVKHAGKGEKVIGSLDRKLNVGVRRVRELLNKANFDCRITKDVKGMIWSKLIINVGINALTAITRLKNGELVKHDSVYRVMRLAVNEAVKVAKRKRIKLAYDDPISKVESVCEATADNISSMLQDVLNKKRTEIDAINGAIVRHAETLGIPVPINSMLVDLVKTIETTYEKQI